MRIALILPQRRLGSWHEELAQTLASRHSLALFVDNSMPRHPPGLRAWLRIERLLYRQQDCPSAIFRKSLHRRAGEIASGGFDVVIDLSERAQPRPGSISIYYGGSTDSLSLVGLLVRRQTPYLTVSRPGAERVLAQSLPAIDDKLRLSRGLQLCFARCIALIERALCQRPVERIADDREPQRPMSGNLASNIGRLLGAKAVAALSNRFFASDWWQVALRNNDGPFVPVRDDGKRYYADPFPYRFQGRTYVVVEEYRQATRKGVIAASEVVGDRLASEPVAVLERPYHLSYPVIVEEAGTIYMLPESSANKTVELYRAVAFPWQWECEKVLIEEMALADATPIFHQNRWWLFACAAQHGTTDHDELFVFYSDRLTGPWRPHARNPVKSDCRSARSAGSIVRHDGRLFRPAQNCEQRYGSGIVWQEIIELTPSRFHEREVARFDASNVPGLRGLHTVSQLDSLQAVDMVAARSFARRGRSTQASMLQLGRCLDLAFSPALPHWRGRDADHPAASRHNCTSRVA